VVVEARAGGGERGLEQSDHREDSGPGVDPEALLLDDAGASAGNGLPVDHDDLVAAADEVAGGRQPAKPGPHHDGAHADSG
jgi:hypothetical protein